MTVKELIERLKDVDGDLPIFYSSRDGSGWGIRMQVTGLDITTTSDKVRCVYLDGDEV